MDPNDRKSGDISWRQGLATAGLALSIPFMIAVPALFGWWLDKKFGTGYLWSIVWLLVGLLSAGLDVYKLLRRFGQFK